VIENKNIRFISTVLEVAIPYWSKPI